MTPDLQHLEDELREALERRHGPLLGGTDLHRALGYPSDAAFRQALHRGQMPVAVFQLPHRRGRFALTREVADWLAGCRQNLGGGLKNLKGRNPFGKEGTMT